MENLKDVTLSKIEKVYKEKINSIIFKCKDCRSINYYNSSQECRFCGYIDNERL